MKIRLFVSIFFVTISAGLFAQPKRTIEQSVLKDSVVSFSMFRIHYGIQWPLADLADRFGLTHSLGAGFSTKTKKNVFIGVEGSFMFGKDIKEPDVLSNLIGPSGALVASNGLLAVHSYSEKGFNIQMQGGKIIPFKKPNKNSGLMALMGAGYLQHKISIDLNDNDVPQLDKEYLKGYDRLTSGFMLSQFIGYFFVDSKHKRINCYAGVEIIEAFTKSRRSWNYDQNRKDDKARKDLLVGLKFGWVIPFYRSQTEKFYYY